MRTEEMFFIKSDGAKIAAKAYIADVDGKNPTVIFSHGFSANYRLLEHHGPTFANAGVNCVFFDFCGGGPETYSDKTMKDMTLLTEIDDLMQVVGKVRALDYVDANSLFLMGESQGGYVSSYVAAQIPDSVRGLVLWYPAYVIPDDSKIRIKNNETTVFGLEISPEYDKVAVSIDIFGEIKKYKGPVQIIHGNRDEIVPISYSKKALEVYDDACLYVIDGAGHGFDGEDSKLAGKISADFVSKGIRRM